MDSEGKGAGPQAYLPWTCSGVRPPPESFLPLREEEGEEEDGNEEEVLSDVSPWTYSSSPDGQVVGEGGQGGCWTEQLKGYLQRVGGGEGRKALGGEMKLGSRVE